ncbi:MAG: hypothetical protein HN348_17410 [Proteobacteria bacterium]|jgi:hypothetical protein|nr:hypothetical protein [Pseudomonadota bacterium]
MADNTIDPEVYKKALNHLLTALAHHGQKARTAKTAEDQIGHASACENLANAFHMMYSGKK